MMTEAEYHTLGILFENKEMTLGQARAFDQWVAHHGESMSWATPKEMIKYLRSFPDKEPYASDDAYPDCLSSASAFIRFSSCHAHKASSPISVAMSLYMSAVTVKPSRRSDSPTCVHLSRARDIIALSLPENTVIIPIGSLIASA